MRNHLPEDGRCKTCKGLDSILSSFDSENVIRWQDARSENVRDSHNSPLTNKDKVHDQLCSRNLQPVALASQSREFLLVQFRVLGLRFGRGPFQRLLICPALHCNMMSVKHWHHTSETCLRAGDPPRYSFQPHSLPNRQASRKTNTILQTAPP